MTEAKPLASFAELRRLADMNPVAHACIEVRTQEITWTDWDIVPESAIRGNRPLLRDFPERHEEAAQFFRRPDPNYASFSSWMRVATREALTTDALTFFLHPPKRPGSGLAGGNVAGLDILDGASIEPVLTGSGRAAGYAQQSGEVPRRSAMDMMALPLTAAPVALYGRDQIRYAPFDVRPWTPFGYSPLEEALEDREDGTEPGSDGRLLEAFGLPAQALGIIDGYLVDDATRDAWLRRYRDGFASIFNALLEGSGLQWKWEGLD